MRRSTSTSRSVSPAGHVARCDAGCPAAARTARTAPGSRQPLLVSALSSCAAASGASAGRWGRSCVIAW